MLLLALYACTAPEASDTAVACERPALEAGPSWDAAALLSADVDPETHPHEQGPGVAIVDLDGDGWQELVVALGVGRSLILHNDGGSFSPVVGPMDDGGELPAANGVGAADLDGDGDAELVLGRAQGLPDLVLENVGGVFTAHVLPDSPGESMAPAFGDVDGDGVLDLLMPGFVDGVALPLVELGLQVGDGHKLYRNAGGLVFEDISEQLPADVQSALSYQAGFVDVDDDGDQDLYFANDFGRYLVPNRLLLREGDAYVAPSDCSCELAMNGMGIGVGDVNGDALPDLFVAGWDGNALLVNDGRLGYIESAAGRGAMPADRDAIVAWGGVFFDLEQDGDADLAWANGPVYIPPEGEENPFGVGDTSPEQHDTLVLNDGDGNYEDWAEELGFGGIGQGRSVTVGDLDRDGRPDLVVSGRVYVDVYFNRGGCAPGLQLRLDGGPGNRAGIGSRVTVTVDGRPRRWWVAPGTAFGMGAAELYVGLGGAAQAEVQVRWPDGAITAPTALPAGPALISR